jgi:predicted RNA-binding Zn-ribbon protein involved in translation (DUF1610 family)
MARVSTPDHAQQSVTRLRTSAESYARSALIHVTSHHDRVRGAIDAGIAVEHMAKAFLASMSPALLADRTSDLDTLLYLTGNGQLAKCSPHEVRTIGAHEACLRCARILPGFTYTQQVDQALFVARNGGAHLALTTDEIARESARIMVRLLEPLLVALEVGREEFWGDLLSVADTLLDEKASQISATVELKIAAAIARLETRLVGLGDSERLTVLKALSAQPYYMDDEEPYECPACGQDGIVDCELIDDGVPRYEVEYADDDRHVETGFIDQFALGNNFRCDACGLRLDFDEMIAAEMETTYDRDPREMEGWEFAPDPD